MHRTRFDHYLAPSREYARINQLEREHTAEVNARIVKLPNIGPINLGDSFLVDGQVVEVVDRYFDGLILMVCLSNGREEPSAILSYKAALGEWPRAFSSVPIMND